MNRFKPQSLTIRFGLRAVFQIGGGENRALASENVTVIAGFEAATQIVRRAEIDLVVAPFEKVDMPSSASRFALPLGRDLRLLHATLSIRYLRTKMARAQRSSNPHPI